MIWSVLRRSCGLWVRRRRSFGGGLSLGFLGFERFGGLFFFFLMKSRKSEYFGVRVGFGSGIFGNVAVRVGLREG